MVFVAMAHSNKYENLHSDTPHSRICVRDIHVRS